MHEPPSRQEGGQFSYDDDDRGDDDRDDCECDAETLSSLPLFRFMLGVKSFIGRFIGHFLLGSPAVMVVPLHFGDEN